LALFSTTEQEMAQKFYVVLKTPEELKKVLVTGALKHRVQKYIYLGYNAKALARSFQKKLPP